MAKIRHLRHEGKLDLAMDRFIKLLKRHPEKTGNEAALYAKLIRQQIFQENCIFLEWTAWMVQQNRRSECKPVLDEILEYTDFLRYEFLRARIGLMGSQVDAEENPDRFETIKKLISLVESDWSWNRSDPLKEPDNQRTLRPNPTDTASLCNGPSFLQHLPDDRTRKTFHELASDTGIGWSHPGLLMAGEMIATLQGSYKRADHKVSTWIVFAGNQRGHLARLTLERLPNGCGLLIPDPLCSGYHRMDEEFSDGFQNAWIANQLWESTVREHDYRWSIDLYESVSKTNLESLFPVRMDGSSAEGSIACAIRAIDKKETLDRNTFMSAQLQKPIESTLKLDRVESLDVKTCLEHDRRIQVRKLRDLIVSDRQTDIEKDTGSQINLVKVDTLKTAYERYGLWPKITRAVKQSLYQRAHQQIIEFCGPEIPEERQEEEGCNYVPSPIADRSELPGFDKDGKPLEPRQLSQEELTDFALMQWRPKNYPSERGVRLRLFADSGVGKTIQLIACEKAIAGDLESPQVPIRIGKASGIKRRDGLISLSDINWSQSVDAVLGDLLQVHLLHHIPEQYKSAAGAWLNRSAELGSFTFLLDALDQTNAEKNGLEPLGVFLATDKICRCPALVAGRRESLASQSNLFIKQDPDKELPPWVTLDLCQLDRELQDEFLGDEAGSILWQYHRKEIWEELMATPILLKMLKDLALDTAASPAGKTLEKINNRKELYDVAIGRLLRKGIRSLQDESDIKRKIDDATKHYCTLAVQMVRRHNFDILEGEAWDQFSSEVGTETAKNLIQVSLVNDYQIIERIETEDLEDDCGLIRRGVDWRHRSFLEYFAAKQLANEFVSNPQALSGLLDEIHCNIDRENQSRSPESLNAINAGANLAPRGLRHDWRWVLRFLLCNLDGEHRNRLARELIRCGNPSIVFDAIDSDCLNVDEGIESISKAISYRDNYSFLLTTARQSGETDKAKAKRELQSDTELLENLLSPNYRDSMYLSLLREVLDGKNFYETYSRESGFVEQMRFLPVSGIKDTSWDFLSSFIKVDGGTFNIRKYHPDVNLQNVEIANFELADFPVTNRVYNFFDPGHPRSGDELTRHDDSPVVDLYWHMATEFCHWLSDVTRLNFRLPTEWEWEWACRWQDTCWETYWWGPEMDERRCCMNRRSRGEAISALSPELRHPSSEIREPGLVDLLGNVAEWCHDDLYIGITSTRIDTPHFSRHHVIRGGPPQFPDVSTSSSRTGLPPGYGVPSWVGFRVCREIPGNS